MESSPRKRGSIVRIKLDNFVSFSNCEFLPGPRLNVILGPNGSGKSSLVCAIGLGLGGSPKILGRGKLLTDFIKQGETEARIEIELHGGEGQPNVTVVRVLDENTSRYRLNGRPASETQVQNRLKDLRVQVDNPVQFLPQDKVVEFSKHDDKELLQETIRAVIGPEHSAMQASIGKLQVFVNTQSTRVEAKKKELALLTAEVKQNERDVSRQQNRAELLEEIAVLKKKLPWVMCDEAHEQYSAAKIELEQLKSNSQTATKAGGSILLGPLKEALKQTKAQYEQKKKESDKASAALRKWSTSMDDHNKAVVELFDSMSDEKTTLSTMAKAKVKKQQQLARQETKVGKLQEKSENKKGEEYFAEELDSLKAQLGPLTDEERQLNLDSARLKSHLTRKSLELSQKKKQEQLRLMISSSYSSLSSSFSMPLTADQERERIQIIQDKLRLPYLQKDKILQIRRSFSSKFKSKVVGPLVCELKTKDEIAGRVLEHFVRANHWKFFVASDAQDHDRMLQEKVSAILVPRPTPPPARSLPADVLAQLGIRGYLDEELVCDPLAIEAAKRLCGIANVLVGTDATDRMYVQEGAKFQQLMSQQSAEDSSIIVLITPTMRLDVKRSRYGDKQLMMRKSLLDPSKLLDLPVLRSLQDEEDERRRQLKQEEEEKKAHKLDSLRAKQGLEQEITEMGEKIKAMDDKKQEVVQCITALRSRRTELMAERTCERNLVTQLESAQEQLELYEKQVSQDWDKKRQRSQKYLDKLKEELEQEMTEMLADSTECAALTATASQSVLSKAQLDCEQQLLQQFIKREETKEMSTVGAVEKCTKKVKEMATSLRDLIRRAKEVCPEDERNELLEVFAPLPDTSDELQHAIDVKTLETNHIHENAMALTEYEKRVKQMEEIGTWLENTDEDLASKKDQLLVELDAWKSPVLDKVAAIDARFKQLFQQINAAGYACSGEVDLGCGDENDISSYGIDIRVKFRQDQRLSRLDASVQSGGERSLTIFLYMLALQEISDMPFVVMDEINQGMDPDKERLAFYRLAQSASEYQSQYFLATPKLLPGLAFPRDATILFVFNGPYGLTQQDWNLNRFVEVAAERRRLNGGGKRVIASSEELSRKKKKRMPSVDDVDEEE